MRRTTMLVLVATLALALAAAGCAPATPTPPAAPTPPATVSPSPSAPATPPVPAGSPAVVKVYFSLHEKMQPVARSAPASTTAVLRAALTSLLRGPSPAEKESGLSSQIPSGTKLLGVSIASKVAVVDLSGRFASGGGTLSMTNRLAQVVFTATQFTGIDSVLFKVDGTTVKVFGGEGIVLDGPRKRADFEDSTPAVLVDSVPWGGALKGGATVRGTANTFEAEFRLQVRDSSGKLVYDKRVMATSGSGTRGTWAAKVPLTGAKAGTGQLRVFEPSAEDGRPTNVVNVRVALTP